MAILQLGNNILRTLGAQEIVQDVSVFFRIGEQMQEAEPGNDEEMAMNIQDLIDLLGQEVLKVDLSAISGAEIVTGNAEHCIELLKLLLQLALELDEDEEGLDPNQMQDGYGDEYGEEDEELQYQEALRVKMEQEELRKQALQQSSQKNSASKEPSKPSVPFSVQEKKKLEINPNERGRSPDRSSVGKSSGQSSTKSAKEEYMKKKLGEQQKQAVNNEEIDDFDSFNKMDSVEAILKVPPKSEEIKKSEPIKPQVPVKAEEKQKRLDDSDSDSPSPPKKVVKKDEDEFKDYDEEEEYDDEEEEEEDNQPYVPPQIGAGNQFMDFRSGGGQGFDSVPMGGMSGMGNQYLFSQPSQAATGLFGAPQKSADAEPQPTQFISKYAKKPENDQPHPPQAKSVTPPASKFEAPVNKKADDSDEYREDGFDDEIEENLPEEQESSDELEKSVELDPIRPTQTTQQKFPTTNPIPAQVDSRLNDLSKEINESISQSKGSEKSESKIKQSQPIVSNIHSKPNFMNRGSAQPIIQPPTQQTPFPQTASQLSSVTQQHQTRFSYPEIKSDQESSSQQSNSFYKQSKAKETVTTKANSTQQHSQKENSQYQFQLAEQKDEGIQYESTDFKGIDFYQAKPVMMTGQKQMRDQATTYLLDQQTQYDLESSLDKKQSSTQHIQSVKATERTVVSKKEAATETIEIEAESKVNQGIGSGFNGLDELTRMMGIKDIKDMNEEERFQLLIYMEGEYDKDPTLFPFKKEMIEDYILNSHPLPPRASVDVSHSTNTKKQNRLVLAKKKVKSKQRASAAQPLAQQSKILPSEKSRMGSGLEKKRHSVKSPTRTPKVKQISKISEKKQTKSVKELDKENHQSQNLESDRGDRESSRLNQDHTREGRPKQAKRPSTAKASSKLKLHQYPKPPKKKAQGISGLPMSIQKQLVPNSDVNQWSASKNDRFQGQSTDSMGGYVVAQSRSQKKVRPQSAKATKPKSLGYYGQPKKQSKPKLPINTDEYMQFLINNYVSTTELNQSGIPRVDTSNNILQSPPSQFQEGKFSQISQDAKFTESAQKVEPRMIVYNQESEKKEPKSYASCVIKELTDKDLADLSRNPKELPQEKQIELQQLLLAKIQSNIRNERAYYYQNIYSVLMKNLTQAKDKLQKSIQKEINPSIQLVRQKQEFDRLYMEYHQEELMKQQAVKNVESVKWQEQKTLEIMEKKFRDQMSQNKKMIAFKRDEFQKQLCQKVLKLATQLEKSKMVEQKQQFREEEIKKRDQNQKILQSMDSYYKDRIQILKENIYNTKFERQLAAQSQRKILENMKRDLNDKKKREIEKYLQVLRNQDPSYQNASYNPKLSQEILNQFKRKQ